MYTDREAFDAMRIFHERRAGLALLTSVGEVDLGAWREWKDCLRVVTRSGEVVLQATNEPADLVEQVISHAEEYEGGLSPICPVCQAELDAPHPDCREKVTRWMKLLR